MTALDEPTGSHLPAQTVSAYLDRSLPPSRMAEVETHLDSCAECRADLAQVATLLARRRRRRRLLVAVPTLAAAASLILLVRSTTTGPTVDRFRTDSAAPGGGAASRINIVGPLESAVLSPDSVLFRWRSTGGAPRATLYRITLTDERGNLVWKSETRDTTSALTAVRLAPGKSYLWYVDALTPDARAATTGIHTFRIAP